MKQIESAINESDIAEASIRLRILKDVTAKQHIVAQLNCRGFDPLENTESVMEEWTTRVKAQLQRLRSA